MAPWLTPGRFPDSDISGSTLVSSSPKLFAAVHVLHRLSTPRHPPRALHSLTVSLRHDSSLSRPGLVPRTLLPRFLERLELLPILLTVAAIFRRLLLLQLSKTRVEVDDLVLEHQPTSLWSLFRGLLRGRSSSSRTRYRHLSTHSVRLLLGSEELVELTGIEPVTSGLQSRRSPS